MSRSRGRSDDTVTLAAIGGSAYAVVMVMHEAIGHGIGCLIAGAHPIVTSVATQCPVDSLAMVVAGPLLNWTTGLALLAYRSGNPRTQPHLVWLLWTVMAFSLLLAAGYLPFCGLAGFGDWAVAAAPAMPARVWRPIAVVAGAVTYYLSLLAVARHRPLFPHDDDGARFRALVLWPYLGAGVVACLAGLLNPIDLTRRLLLPVASSFGACFGVTRIPGIDVGRSRRGGNEPLARLDRRPAWLAGMAIAIVLFIGMLGPGTR